MDHPGRLGAVPLVAVLLLPGLAAAQASFTAQDREVSVSSQSLGSLWDEDSSPLSPDFDPPTLSLDELAEDSTSAPDEGPFDEEASTVDPVLVAIAPEGSAEATQTSSLSPALVSATGGFSNTADARPLTQPELDLANTFFMPPVPFDLGLLGDLENAGSHFSATFDVAVPTSFSLSGTISLSPEVGAGIALTAGSAAIVLTGGPQGLVEFVSVAQDGIACDPGPCTGITADAIELEGVLQPGTYTLAARAEGAAEGLCGGLMAISCFTSSSTGSFDVTLDLAPAAPPVVPAGPLPAMVGLWLALVASGTLLLRRTRRARGGA